PAAISTLQRHSDVELILVGDEAIISAEIAKHQFSDKHRMKIQHASQTVGMDEPPSSALRGKKDSSMRVAINLVKEGQAAACVSAGNTGA
ncbi:MAG TPA: phosphate acyltransferase, partial [Methylophaga sp.]|nr:phosphate acyltransferase [Methylophaga sp.]